MPACPEGGKAAYNAPRPGCTKAGDRNASSYHRSTREKELGTAWIERPGRKLVARSLRSDRALTRTRRGAQAGTAGSSRPALELTLGFVGSGRAARSLARRLARGGHRVVVARRGVSAQRLAADLGAPLLAPVQTLATADVTILAVPDGRLATLVEELAAKAQPGQGRVVLHLAGSLGVEVLEPLADRG